MVLLYLGVLGVGERREESSVIAVLKFCLFIKPHRMFEILAGLLFASDIPRHLEMGLRIFCSLDLGLGFFVSLVEQETIVIHLVDRTNVTVITNSFILT